MTSINISLTLTLGVCLSFDLSVWRRLIARAEHVCCIGIPVGFIPNYRWGSLLSVGNRAQSAIHSVLTTRIILNIREAASQRLDDHSFDLHLSDTDSHASGSRMLFAENTAVFHSGSDQESDVSRRVERHDSGSSMGQVGMVSISTRATISHVTLPMTRDARGKRVVGRVELDDDDDKDSIVTSPEDWV